MYSISYENKPGAGGSVPRTEVGPETDVETIDASGNREGSEDGERVPQSDQIEFAHCVVHRGRRELWTAGTKRRLEPKAFDLLMYLIDNSERVVSRDELLVAVWKRKFLTDSVVARAVMKVRRAIDDLSEEDPMIMTQHRVGYRLVCAVKFPDDHVPSAAPAGVRPDRRDPLNQPADPFIAEALSRCVEAVTEQRFEAALRYIEICIDEDDTPLPLAVEHVARLAAVLDPSTPSRAAALLVESRAKHDRISEALLLTALASYHHATGTQGQAAELADSALSLSDGAQQTEMFGDILLLRSEICLAERQFAAAQKHLSHALSLAQALGSVRLEAAAIRLSATILMQGGDHAGAVDALARASALCRQVGVRHSDLASTLLRLALILKDLGNLREAVSVAEEAVSHAAKAGTITVAALATLLLIVLYIHAGNPAAAIAARRSLDTHRMRSNVVAAALASMADGCLAWRVGRLEEACLAFQSAQSVTTTFGQFWGMFALDLNVSLLVTAGKYVEARQLIGKIEEHASFAHDAGLQALALFGTASLVHAQGQHAQAFDNLQQVLAVAPTGNLRAQASLCAAWLACERSELVRSAQWLAESGEWLRQSPRGLMAEARYKYELGDLDGAFAAHAACLAKWPTDQVAAYDLRLLELYGEAATQGQKIDLPTRPLFLTLSF